jgi:hypothetical protein
VPNPTSTRLPKTAADEKPSKMDDNAEFSPMPLVVYGSLGLRFCGRWTIMLKKIFETIMVGTSLTRHPFLAFLVLVRAPFSVQKEMASCIV